jgi:hypothetical protein
MAYSYLERVESNADGSTALFLQVSGYEAGAPVEISGTITQPSGTAGSFCGVQLIPSSVNPGDPAILVVTVPTRLTTGETVTVIARVTDAWVTVLDPSAESVSSRFPGTAWRQGPAPPGEPVPAAEDTWRPVRSSRFYGSLPPAEADE